MEGESCKIKLHKICVSNQYFFMKQNKNQKSYGLILKHLQPSNAFQFPLNVIDAITQYWMYFVG